MVAERAASFYRDPFGLTLGGVFVPLMSLEGHQNAFLPPRLSARYSFSQRTLVGMRGNGRDAPKAAVERQTRNRKPTLSAL